MMGSRQLPDSNARSPGKIEKEATSSTLNALPGLRPLSLIALVQALELRVDFSRQKLQSIKLSVSSTQDVLSNISVGLAQMRYCFLKMHTLHPKCKDSGSGGGATGRHSVTYWLEAQVSRWPELRW